MPATNTKAKKPRHSLANDKRFLELGRRHFAEDFPNPSRKTNHCLSTLLEIPLAPALLPALRNEGFTLSPKGLCALTRGVDSVDVVADRL